PRAAHEHVAELIDGERVAARARPLGQEVARRLVLRREREAAQPAAGGGADARGRIEHRRGARPIEPRVAPDQRLAASFSASFGAKRASTPICPLPSPRTWYRSAELSAVGGNHMNTRYTTALTLLAGVAIGALAVQGLHAQSKPPVYLVSFID